jgi:hypothetical protein
VGGVHLRNHGVGRFAVKAAQRIGVERDHVVRQRQRPALRNGHAGDGDCVADQLNAQVLQELGGNRAHGDARGGFAGAGALKHGTGLVKAVLLHAGEVGVSGARPGQRGVPGLAREFLGVHRIG